jgi:hypothetical protein
MNAGFTGTRNGMTDAQKAAVLSVLLKQGVTSISHGDCVGADEDVHLLARMNGVDVNIYPPTDSSLRAFCMGAKYMAEPKTHFARNRDIVDTSDILIATPALMVETDTGGTWYTIRYARKKGKPVLIVWPDGALTKENE